MNVAAESLLIGDELDRVRLDKRVSFRGDVHVYVPAMDMRICATGLNISETGCFVLSQILLPVGTGVRVRLSDGDCATMDVAARVVRVVSEGARAGMAFVFVGEASATAA
jgi:hypothetical protein